MYNNVKYNYNVFKMIKKLFDFLYETFDIKYEYTKDNDYIITITSKFDINSIYDNSTTVAHSIYNLVYDYYNNIYTYYLNEFLIIIFLI